MYVYFERTRHKKGQNMNVLDKIMKPKSIAVVGASTKPKTIGSEIMQRLRDYKFNGKIYPVNPKGGMIEGFQAYTSISEIPGEVDLAVIVVNAKFVLDTIDQCNAKGIKGLCIITAGFKETGAEGAEMEKQLLAKVKEYGMRCVGPNCLGVLNTNPKICLNYTGSFSLAPLSISRIFASERVSPFNLKYSANFGVVLRLKLLPFLSLVLDTRPLSTSSFMCS